MKKLFLLLALASCKQGAGERCQVDDDCSSPLVCNQAKFECQSPGGTDDFDAGLVDAPTIIADVPVIVDAGVDAAADAPVDSTTPIVDAQ